MTPIPTLPRASPNPWIAGAAAAAAASVIVAPTMIPRIVRAMKASGVKVAPAAPAESEK